MTFSSTFAAVLLTDMVESTETRVRLGPAFNRLMREHDQLIVDVLTSHAPTRRDDTGDGFRATFDSTTMALAAACAIQWGVKERNEVVDPQHRFVVRIALSAGEIYGREDKRNGMAFVEAARLEMMAGASEIWCTDVFRLLASEQAPGLFILPEEVPFKGIEEPRLVWRVDWAAAPPVPTDLPLPEALTARPDEVFVGRTLERAQIVRNWEKARHSGNRLVLVWGEAGTGKSALARSVAQELHQQRAWVLYGRCDPDAEIPFQPFGEALATFFRDTGGSRHILGRGYAHLTPLLAEATGPQPLSPLAAVDPEAGRFALFEAVSDWLAMTSAENGVLFVIDDLHLADAPTFELVRHLLRVSSAGNVCVVATCRWSDADVSSSSGGALQELARHSDQVDDVALRGFGEIEVREALARRAPSLPLGGASTAAFVRDLHAYTGGNPLLVQAILADLLDVVLTHLSSGSPEPVKLDTLGVPEDVQELFRQRRRRVGSAAWALLDVGCVVGPTFDSDLVAAVADVSPDVAGDAFSELVDAGLICPSRPGTYEFSHAVIREAAIRNLLPGRRIEFHLRLAQEIESRGDPSGAAAELSHHYAASSDPAHRRVAAGYAEKAGDRALTSLAADLAARHYRRALEQFDALPHPISDVDRCDLVSKLATALKQAGDPAATDALLEAARLARVIGDAPRMARSALATLSEAWGVTGAVDEAKVEVLEAAVAAVGDQDPALRARLLAGLAAELTFSPRRARVNELSREAVALARQLYDAPPPDGDKRVLARVLEHHHTILLHPKGLAERRQVVAELDRLSSDGGPNRAFTAASYGFWTAMELGDVGECRKRVQVMRVIVESVNQPRLVALTMHWQSSLAALLGQIDDAERFASESAELWSSIGIRDALVFSVGLRYLPLWYRCRLHDVIDDIEACAAPHPGRVGMRAGRAHAWSVLGNLDRAAEALDEIDLEGTDGHHDQLVALSLSAMAASSVGDLGRLQLVRKLLLPFHAHVVFNGTSCFGSVEHYLAVTSASLEDFDEADARFHAASVAHATMTAPALLALTKLEWAKMLLRRRAASDGVRGRVLLEETLTIAHGLGLTCLENESHRLLAAENQTSQAR